MAAVFISVLVFTVLALGPVDSGFVLTTPRRWTVESQSQICFALTNGKISAVDSLQMSLRETKHGELLQDGHQISLPEGLSEGCVNVTVPYTEDRMITLDLTGSLTGDQVSESFNITFVKETGRTFIQTDKYLYKPGQKVQFRVLSVKGPNLTIVTENYEEVYIVDPSRTRIAQWLDVDNSGGLIHLTFDLYDEIQEGMYTIGTKLKNQSPEERAFRVEDYVLPRYEVTIEAPKDILGNDSSVTVKLCAKYTFGEPVNGNATIYLAAGSWRTYANLTETKKISGCQNFTFPTKDLLFDHNNCHIRISNLKSYAIVVEDGTGVELRGTNNRITVHRRGIQFRDESASWVKRPYLPSSVKIAAIRPNKQPAVNEPVEACIYYEEEKICKNLTTSNTGHIKFVMPSQTDSRVEVRALNHPRIERNWNDVMEESRYFKYNYNNEQYVDPTNSSLTIFLEDKMECRTGEGVNFEIPVIYISNNQPSADIYVQASSRGQIISMKKLPVEFVDTELPFKSDEQLLPLEDLPAGFIRGMFKIPMSLSEISSPNIKVLVWYSGTNGDIVADFKEVEISDCLSYNVSFTWSTNKAEPGESANLVLSGANNALCSIGVVDKSVALLSSENNKLDVQSILQIAYNSEVAQWDNDQLNLEYCLRKYGSPSQNETGESIDGSTAGLNSFARKPSIYNRFSMLEAIHMFKNAGYFVSSNLGLEKLFCDDLIIQDMKNKVNFKPSTPTSSFGNSQNRIHVSPVSFNSRPVGFPASAGFAGGVAHTPTSVEMDSEDAVPSQKEGGAESEQERSYLPETWLWELKTLSATGELNEAKILPDTITEWVGRAVCVHPTEGVGISSDSSIVTFTPFFVDLTLPSSAKRGEILPIVISVFNYLEEDLPVKVTLEQSENIQLLNEETGMRELCISSKMKKVETIKVNLTQIGDVNITVQASVEPISSGSCGSGSSPSKIDRLIRTLPVEPEGYVREKTWTKYVCSQDIEGTEGSFDKWVIQSPEAIVPDSERGWITVIGDLMGPTLENIGHLIKFPSGCGEQNMINFAPNIYILKYLEATNQTTEFIKSKIQKFLKQGYQVQQMFRHKNGSFSAFGERDKEGSTWLTAFVIKSLSQAKPFTFIDAESLQFSVDWLKNLQNTKGCFESRGRVINKMLQGGIKGSGGSEELLTAYVLMALLEEGNVTEEVISSAIQCIERDTSEHPYSLALKTYVLALAKHPNVKIVLDKLIGSAITNSSMMRWNLPDRKGESTALHVETAAYALLGLVTLDPKAYAEESRKIVRWISSQRNGQGGFISTQDTIVAMQALATFEEAQPKESTNLDITITTTDLNESFNVKDDNKFLEQRVDIPTLPSTFDLSLSGQGCALVQGVLRYNVLAESMSEAFVLRSETMQAEKDCRTQSISACVSYTLPDEASNMAILEVKLVSGYIPLKNDLKEVIGDGKGTFKRYEVDGPKIIFYMEEVNSTEVCSTFRVYQEVPIENAKPGSVTVYDYYQPEYTVTQKFNFLSNCGSEN